MTPLLPILVESFPELAAPGGQDLRLRRGLSLQVELSHVVVHRVGVDGFLGRTHLAAGQGSRVDGLVRRTVQWGTLLSSTLGHQGFRLSINYTWNWRLFFKWTLTRG